MKNIDNIIEYDHIIFEEQMFYFNEKIRKCKIENKYYNKKLGYLNIWDCWSESIILEDYLKLNNKEVTKESIWDFVKDIAKVLKVKSDYLLYRKNSKQEYLYKNQMKNHDKFHEYESKYDDNKRDHDNHKIPLPRNVMHHDLPGMKRKFNDNLLDRELEPQRKRRKIVMEFEQNIGNIGELTNNIAIIPKIKRQINDIYNNNHGNIIMFLFDYCVEQVNAVNDDNNLGDHLDCLFITNTQYGFIVIKNQYNNIGIYELYPIFLDKFKKLSGNGKKFYIFYGKLKKDSLTSKQIDMILQYVLMFAGKLNKNNDNNASIHEKIIELGNKCKQNSLSLLFDCSFLN